MFRQDKNKILKNVKGCNSSKHFKHLYQTVQTVTRAVILVNFNIKYQGQQLWQALHIFLYIECNLY